MMVLRKKSKWTRKRSVRYLTQLGYIVLITMSAYSENFPLALALLVSALVGGAFFCGWLCPLGTAQEWLGRLGHLLLGGKRFRIPPKVDRWLLFSRYLLLMVSLSSLTIFAFTYFLSNPYQTFQSFITVQWSYIGWIAWIYLGLLLFISLFIDRPFCRYFCIHGAQYGVLSLLRIFSIRRNSSKCINCRLCDTACPTQVVISTKKHIRHPQCVNCMDCIDACPVKGALEYKCVLPNVLNKLRKESS